MWTETQEARLGRSGSLGGLVRRGVRRGPARGLGKTGFLEKAHSGLAARRYLEIGVREGASLSKALAGAYAVGVDPWPDIGFRLGKRTHVYEVGSDDFFGSTSGRLEGPFDLILIDGLHQWEQVVRDFVASERVSHSGSVIIIDDVLPPSADSASRWREGRRIWAGDCWKILPVLHHFRPDLGVRVMNVPPAGMAVVEGLKSESTDLEGSLEGVWEFGGRLRYERDYRPEEWLTAECDQVLRHWRSQRGWRDVMFSETGRVGRWCRLLPGRLRSSG